MFYRQKRFWAVFLGIVILLATGMDSTYAYEIITVGPQDSKIEGSIKYTVIGKYTAHFGSFQGRITYDGKSQQIRSVYLDIDAGSIQSDYPWCDKFARSRRLLNTRRYPKIIFKSNYIIEEAGVYLVKGVLEMHGIKKRMAFPFKFEIIHRPWGGKLLELEGRWNINRKDFNIIWNKLLDHGGIIVSDIFTVDWGIRVRLS